MERRHTNPAVIPTPAGHPITEGLVAGETHETLQTFPRRSTRLDPSVNKAQDHWTPATKSLHQSSEPGDSILDELQRYSKSRSHSSPPIANWRPGKQSNPAASSSSSSSVDPDISCVCLCSWCQEGGHTQQSCQHGSFDKVQRKRTPFFLVVRCPDCRADSFPTRENFAEMLNADSNDTTGESIAQLRLDSNDTTAESIAQLQDENAALRSEVSKLKQRLFDFETFVQARLSLFEKALRSQGDGGGNSSFDLLPSFTGGTSSAAVCTPEPPIRRSASTSSRSRRSAECNEGTSSKFETLVRKGILLAVFMKKDHEKSDLVL
ncbi:hypothetical protein BJ742DRAFT_869400 [Cladochytrium replicatum]|nr:hypothetical protein BJ742DRAFT_869400 [Cladochytrium replicatum]